MQKNYSRKKETDFFHEIYFARIETYMADESLVPLVA
jgi:hypothetical protein